MRKGTPPKLFGSPVDWLAQNDGRSGQRVVGQILQHIFGQLAAARLSLSQKAVSLLDTCT